MGVQTRNVDRALRMVDAGATPYRAAKDTGIALSTIYRALARRKASTEPVEAALERLAKLRRR